MEPVGGAEGDETGYPRPAAPTGSRTAHRLAAPRPAPASVTVAGVGGASRQGCACALRPEVSALRPGAGLPLPAWRLQHCPLLIGSRDSRNSGSWAYLALVKWIGLTLIFMPAQPEAMPRSQGQSGHTSGPGGTSLSCPSQSLLHALDYNRNSLDYNRNFQCLVYRRAGLLW